MNPLEWQHSGWWEAWGVWVGVLLTAVLAYFAWLAYKQTRQQLQEERETRKDAVRPVLTSRTVRIRRGRTALNRLSEMQAELENVGPGAAVEVRAHLWWTWPPIEVDTPEGLATFSAAVQERADAQPRPDISLFVGAIGPGSIQRRSWTSSHVAETGFRGVVLVRLKWKDVFDRDFEVQVITAIDWVDTLPE
jgi:hypothetical protein